MEKSIPAVEIGDFASAARAEDKSFCNCPTEPAKDCNGCCSKQHLSCLKISCAKKQTHSQLVCNAVKLFLNLSPAEQHSPWAQALPQDSGQGWLFWEMCLDDTDGIRAALQIRGRSVLGLLQNRLV